MEGLLKEVLQGFSDRQLNEASLFTLVNYLKEKGIIDFEDFSEYYVKNLNNVLKLVVDRDKKHAEEIMSINKNKNTENV